jgi:short/branched chain acyl-CoA dehydrogenase
VDIIGPKVREMDEKERMDPDIIKACFDQGVRAFFIRAGVR